MKIHSRQRKSAVGTAKVLTCGVLISALALVTGCAGGVGSEQGGSVGVGFEYGASQEEVNEVISDLEPVKITLQSGAGAENSIAGRKIVKIKEEIERRSNGQVEVEIIWGMAIAGHTEAVDALVDGRIDISYHLTSYEPQRFPEANAIGTALGSVEYSPMVGELLTYAVGASVGWNNEALLDRYESEGVTPLNPLLSGGTYSLSCNSEVLTGENLKGKQVRIASAAQGHTLSNFGAVPVSMEFTETFEALQRNTIDCDMSTMSAKEIVGLADVAPNVGYTTTANWPRFSASYLAGPNVEKLPLPYQQIIFDSFAFGLGASVQSILEANASHVGDLNSVGGTVEELDEKFQAELGKFSDEQVRKSIEEGHLPEDIIEQVQDLSETWSQRLTDLGFEDGGRMTEMDEWYDPDVDLSEYAWEVQENSGALAHRPA